MVDINKISLTITLDSSYQMKMNEKAMIDLVLRTKIASNIYKLFTTMSAFFYPSHKAMYHANKKYTFYP